jgi:hypothetical protein
MSAAEAQGLRARAAKCRRLAKGIDSRDVETSLKTLADEYDRDADAMDPPRPDLPKAT